MRFSRIGKERVMKKCRCFLAFCFVLFMSLMIGKTDALAATKNLTANGSWVDGNLTVKGEPDFYRVTISQPGTLKVTYQGLSVGYSTARILDENLEEEYADTELIANSSAANPKTKEISADLQAGTYMIRIYSQFGYDLGTYRFKVEFEPANSQDAEPNDSFAQAMPLSGERNFIGFLAKNEDYDFFTFTLPKATMVTIRYANYYYSGLDKPGVDGIITLYDSDYKELEHKRSINSLYEFSEKLDAGRYYIRVSSFSGSGIYRLWFSDTHTHTWDEGKVVTEATCTTNGKKTYTCSICGETKTETIAKTGHKYKTTTTRATTKKNGSIVKKCTLCGRTSSKTTIYRVKSVTLSRTSYTYNGKVQKPSVTVKDTKGKKLSSSYYTVSYAKGRKAVGTYKVTIKLKGRYSGTITKTFKILPKATKISSIKGASKGFTVKWKKQASQVTGYQIQYSTSKKMTGAKTVRVKGASKISYTKKSLSAKKRYYVRVRTYRTVSGKTYYSSWSSIKSVRTK